MIVNKYGRVAGSIDLAALAELHAKATDDDLKAHYREVAAENGLELDAPAEEPAEVPVPEPAPVEAPAEEPAEDLSGLSKAELFDLAAAAGVDGADRMTKTQLLEALGG